MAAVFVCVCVKWPVDTSNLHCDRADFRAIAFNVKNIKRQYSETPLAARRRVCSKAHCNLECEQVRWIRRENKIVKDAKKTL